MAYSPETDQPISSYPSTLSSFLEFKISEKKKEIDSLSDYLQYLEHMHPEGCKSDEYTSTDYRHFRANIALAKMQYADVHLRRGDSRHAFELLSDEIADLNNIAEQCCYHGCFLSALDLIHDINTLREITY